MLIMWFLISRFDCMFQFHDVMSQADKKWPVKQDLVHLKEKYKHYYHNEVFVDIFYDADRFKNVTHLDWSIARYADKYSIAVKKAIERVFICFYHSHYDS